MLEGREIERQFKLLLPASEIVAQAARNRTLLTHYDIWQSYFRDTGEWTIRLRRVVHQNLGADTYEQTMKRTIAGIERIEEPINLDRATYERLLRHCGPTLRKTRHEIALDDRIWEIDVFLNAQLAGLELVEVELPAVDTAIVIPDWVGEETSHDPSYRNAVIVKRLESHDMAA